MAILDRPLFQRRPTRDELMAYGLPAFANGGIVYANTGGLQMQSAELKPGGKVPGRRYYNKETGKFEVYQPEPETAITSVIEERPSFSSGALDSTLKLEAEKKTDVAPTEEMYDFDIELKEKPTPPEDLDKKIGKEEKELSDLEELKQKYLEKSKLYKEILGNPEEMNRRQGFLQLAQFGLNLASAQGSNFLDKVAKSAKDPLNAFAELGRKAYEDERAVSLLALEATEEDIKAAKEAELEKELAEIKGTDTTTFQKDLALIQSTLTDLDPLDQVKIAKGLRLGETDEDKIQSTFELLLPLPLYTGKEDAAMAKAIELVTGQKPTTNVANTDLTAIGQDSAGKTVYQNKQGQYVYGDGSLYEEPKE